MTSQVYILDSLLGIFFLPLFWFAIGSVSFLLIYIHSLDVDFFTLTRALSFKVMARDENAFDNLHLEAHLPP